jgi:hypothetical protein
MYPRTLFGRAARRLVLAILPGRHRYTQEEKTADAACRASMRLLELSRHRREEKCQRHGPTEVPASDPMICGPSKSSQRPIMNNCIEGMPGYTFSAY